MEYKIKHKKWDMKFVLYQNRFIHLCLCDKISTTAEYYYTSQ